MNLKNSKSIPEGCVEACRGCSFRNLSIKDGADKKLRWLKSKLAIWQDKIHPVNHIDEGKQFGYREKVSLSAMYNGQNWEFGMWNRDVFISIPDCPVHSPKVNSVVRLFSSILPSYQHFPLHYLIIAEKQVTLVLKTKSIDNTTWFTNEVQVRLAAIGIDAVWIHLNSSAGHRMFEKTPWIHLWGNIYSLDYKGFLYGPSSFHQLIPELYQHSLLIANNFLAPSNNSLVVDLYCGIGHSLSYWIGSGASVIGIESSSEAVKYAVENVPGAKVLRGQCHTRIGNLAQIIEENNLTDNERLLYLNPPRTGLGEKVTDWILKEYIPSKICYLSCSAGTLSRDLEILTKSLYSVVQITPYDFFPNTHHVETLVMIKLKSHKS